MRICNNKRNTTWIERHPRATPTQPAWNSNITEQCGRGRSCAPSVSAPYYVSACAYTRRVPYIVCIVSHTYRIRTTHRCTHTRAHPRTMRSQTLLHAPPQHSLAMHVLQSRRSGAFSVALSTVPLRVHQSLVRAYISKPVVTAPPRRYLSHASGADFYRRGDSRGKFIKSLLPAPPRAHHALSRGLGGRGCSSSSYLYLYFLRLSVA